MKTNQYKSIQDFIDYITPELKTDTPVWKGNLKNSWESNVKETEYGFSIEFLGLSYGATLDKGVNGTDVYWGSPYTYKKAPSVLSLTEWSESKGLNAALVSQSLYKNGLRPRYFIVENVDKTVGELADTMPEAIWDDFYLEDLENQKKNNTNNN